MDRESAGLPIGSDPSPMLLQEALELVWVIDFLQAPYIWRPVQDLCQDARAPLFPVQAPLRTGSVQLICMVMCLQYEKSHASNNRQASMQDPELCVQQLAYDGENLIYAHGLCTCMKVRMLYDMMRILVPSSPFATCLCRIELSAHYMPRMHRISSGGWIV